MTNELKKQTKEIIESLKVRLAQKQQELQTINPEFKSYVERSIRIYQQEIKAYENELNQN